MQLDSIQHHNLYPPPPLVPLVTNTHPQREEFQRPTGGNSKYVTSDVSPRRMSVSESIQHQV